MSNYRSYSENGSSSNSCLNSVGIDIGTTSCHLVFSRLGLANEAGATQIPRLVIREREVLYESPIHLTPLSSDGTIDGAKVAELLRAEYLKSGFKPDDINCGAVIITGETARLRNAERVLNEISALAGDFVAASAGPDLESVLAGRGSGAYQYSLDNHKTICNIDIGGGTTNIAVFRNGELVETGCVRIGGRCLRFSKEGTLTGSSESAKHLLEILSQNPTELDELKNFGRDVAELIVQFVTKAGFTGKLERLLMTEPLSLPHKVDEYWLSGGVAELLKNPGDDPFVFEDFGWFLAQGLKEMLATEKIAYRVSENPLRATVLGAGSYSVQLSGNTVSVSTTKLPLKGIPLIRPFQSVNSSALPDSKTVSSQLEKSISIFDGNLKGLPAAIILDLADTPRYQNLKGWSEVLAHALKESSLGLPYILIVGSDSAMALGQLLKGMLREREIIVLDGIDLKTGDFIDIGKPLGSGMTIPVTVKSLVFANEHS